MWRFGANREAEACRVLWTGCSAGPAGDVRTYGMRGNTLQLLIEIAATSSWIIRECLTTVHLGGRAITKRAMLELQK